MVKTTVLQPLEKVTHARYYLKAQRTGAASFDRDTVHRVFRKWYRCNDDKLAVILRDSPTITIGDSGHYNSPCFQFDGINVSSKLSPPTPEASVTAALREIEYRTRPADLKRRGWEMDHMNDGGFAAIRDAFVAEHGLATIHSALHRSNLNDMDTLPTALYDAFVQLHATMTEDYSLCELITKDEHARRTLARMCC